MLSSNQVSPNKQQDKRHLWLPFQARAANRLTSGVKRFQPILTSAKSRDVNESDTIIIVTDMLSEVFGYDKYAEITSEFAIRGTYCDLALKLDAKPRLLIEVKAIGSDLKDAYVKQAVDYAANQGIEWVALTNGILWRIYRITFAQPISQDLVVEIDFLALNAKNDGHLESLYLITREGLMRSVLDEYHMQRQAMSRFFLGAMILSDTVLDVVRRELRKISPGVKIETEEIRTILTQEVLKRDVLEGDKADEAKKKISRAQGRAIRTKATKTATDTETSPPTPATVPPTGIVPPSSTGSSTHPPNTTT